ncbi:MAG: CvpA family protein [Oscillospiraceae bacterium]|nr:CvpA family protein [Oscillospiraceae bacterium]
MAFIIDFVLIAILGLSFWRGWKNGLVRGIFGILGLLVAIIGANILANTFSPEFSGMLRPFVGGLVDSTLTDVLRPAGSDAVDGDVPLDVEGGGEVYNAAYNALRKIGLFDSAAKSLAEKIAGDTEGGGNSISRALTDKLTSTLSYVAVFAIAFILLSIIIAVIGNLVNFVFELPGLKLLNAIAGGTFGLGKGLLVVLFIALVVRYVGILKPDAVEQTAVLDFFVNHNVIANTLGI